MFIHSCATIKILILSMYVLLLLSLQKCGNMSTKLKMKIEAFDVSTTENSIRMMICEIKAYL